MDVCCLNRPFDNLEQERVRLEAEAIVSIINRCKKKQWELVHSEAIDFELSNTSKREKAELINTILSITTIKIDNKPEIEDRANSLINLGFKLLDSLHIAFAEVAEANVMLTTDDRLLRKAKKYSTYLQINVDNPVTWLMSIIQKEQDNEIN